MSPEQREALRQVFETCVWAGQHGGFWVSHGGGTRKVMAGEISRLWDIKFEDALTLLDEAGSEFFGTKDWYKALEEISNSKDKSSWEELPWQSEWLVRATLTGADPSSE